MGRRFQVTVICSSYSYSVFVMFFGWNHDSDKHRSKAYSVILPPVNCHKGGFMISALEWVGQKPRSTTGDPYLAGKWDFHPSKLTAGVGASPPECSECGIFTKSGCGLPWSIMLLQYGPPNSCWFSFGLQLHGKKFRTKTKPSHQSNAENVLLNRVCPHLRFYFVKMWPARVISGCIKPSNYRCIFHKPSSVTPAYTI